MSDYILVGKIVNTFGLKGELKISTESDFIKERFGKGSKIYLKLNGKYQEFTISSSRMIKGLPTIVLNDLVDINDVTKYVGLNVYSSTDDNPVLDDNEYYIDDLVGLKVLFPDKQQFGIVKDIIILPANDVMEIETLDGKKELIPFVDDFVKEVNEDYIVIRHFEVDND